MKHTFSFVSALSFAMMGVGCASPAPTAPAQVLPPIASGTAANVQTRANAQLASTGTSFRPPSVPLITHDPYFSVWSNSTRLTDSATTHWTGRSQPLTSLVRVDGKTFRLMGDTPADVPALEQTGVQVTPTRSIYSFAGGGVRVRLTFTSPLLPQDLDLLSRPLSYVTWDVSSTDGQTHDAALYFDASSALAVNDPSQKVVWKRQTSGALTALGIGTQDQPVLAKTGDDLRIDWGYLYVAPVGGTASMAIGNKAILEAGFGAGSALPTSDDARQPREQNNGEPAAALSFPLGKVGGQSVSRTAMVAYDDEYSVQFMGHNLRPYWRRGGADAMSLLHDGARNYPAIESRCAAFDSELTGDMTRVGGAKFAQLGALAFRQSLAAQKLVVDAGGKPLSFAKENNSNGCIATVDVFYPAAPEMLAFSPSLLKASLQPIMLYASSRRWKFPFAPHDLGTYPKANGQLYGGGENNENDQMPIEETGNLMIVLAALSKEEGSTRYVDQFWPAVSRWAGYLAAKGFDPESQLSTDDFAGHLAHNANLSAKAIVAIGAYAQMAQMRGDTATATKYRGLAQRFAAQWMQKVPQNGPSLLAFDAPNTWSQKYNLVWDGILGLNLFPASLYSNEMAFYKTKLNAYGLPLDVRRDYTKLDWQLWTGTLTGKRDDLDAIVNPVYDWMNVTTSRVPLTDWYDTKDGQRQNFKARSVVGGVFIPMLRDGATWKKWAGRDTASATLTGWAPMPTRPSFKEFVPTGNTTAGLVWRYTFSKPGDNWFAPDFSDAAWKTGEAGFGSGGTPGIHVRTNWNTDDIWIRRTFTLSGPLPAQTMLYGFHDEDIDVYINGQLAGTLGGYNATYEALFPIRAGLLKSGQNTIAVHCHQTGGGQGVDIGFATQVPDTLNK